MKPVEAVRRIALQNMLFATDFSPCSDAALPYALSVARRYGATLHVAHVMPAEADLLFRAGENWRAVAEEEKKRIQGYIERLESQFQGLPHSVITPRGEVSDTLAQIIEEHEIDMLVLGTHGRTGIRKLFMGSVAEKMFRRAVCPVVSVGPNVSRKPNDEIRFNHILFATDFSRQSLAALPYALSLAEEDQAQLVMLHVIEQPTASIPDFEAVTASLTRRLKALVPPEAEPWCRAECLIEFGRKSASAAELILQVARDKAADLIVLGVSPVQAKLGLGTHFANTTTQILTQGTCPVLTVRG
jgi:nucleotide-binding universal stress UspA family protein